MKAVLIAYIAALLAFLIIDGIWLGVLAKNFYANHLGGLLRQSILAVPALVFYLLYTAGIVFLAVRPDNAQIPLTNVALHGAVLGLMAYGTYNLTNYATLRDWPGVLSVVDMSWGCVLTASVAVVSALSVRHFT
ncbi:MAG: DUF2177 family protein [Granulosicoccus sp.]